MHADAFDRFHEADSRLHRLDPRVKVVVTVLFILSNALLPDGAWAAFGLSWIVLLWANHLSSLGVDFTFRRSFIALPFALAAVSAIFSPLGNPLADWSIGPLTLIPTDFGLIKFGSIIIRSWLSVQAAILLVATTRFPDMIHAFEHLRVPRMLTTIVAFPLSLSVRTDGRGLASAQGAAIAQCNGSRPEVWKKRCLESASHRQYGRSTLPAQLRTLRPHLQRHAGARLHRSIAHAQSAYHATPATGLSLRCPSS